MGKLSNEEVEKKTMNNVKGDGKVEKMNSEISEEEMKKLMEGLEGKEIKVSSSRWEGKVKYKVLLSNGEIKEFRSNNIENAKYRGYRIGRSIGENVRVMKLVEVEG